MTFDEMPDQLDERMRQVLAQCGVDDPRAFELLFALQAPMRLLGLVISRHLQDSDLSLPRLGLLLGLYFGEQFGSADGLSPSQLSRFRLVSRNTISALLRSLEAEGLIERALCPEDHRRFHIRLSPTGRALVCTLIPQQGTFLNDLFSGLSADEQATLIALLGKLRRSLRERVEAIHET